MFMGIAFILMQIKSPMLVSVGMYLPIDTSFAIFLGGIFKGIVDRYTEKKKLPEEDKEKVNNTGTLLASGLIAGEALIGILFAALKFFEVDIPEIFKNPSYIFGFIGIVIIGSGVVWITLRRLKVRD